MHVSAFILQLWHRKEPVGVSQKRKRHFYAYNDWFLKYEVILQYKLFTLLDIPTQYTSTQKVQ